MPLFKSIRNVVLSKVSLVASPLPSSSKPSSINTTITPVYDEGLKSVLLADDPQLYAELQKEGQKVSVKLIQRKRGGFCHLLPYDTLCMIFGNLNYDDLICCTYVCKQWFEFLVDLPEFWEKLLVAMPSLPKSTLETFIRNNIQEFCFEDILEFDLIHDICLYFAARNESHPIEKLSFKNCTISTSQVSLIGDIMKNVSSSLRQVQWINCYMSLQNILRYILLARTSYVTYATFSHNFENISAVNCWKLSVTLQKNIFASSTYPAPTAAVLSYLKIDVSRLSYPVTHKDDPIKIRIPALVAHFPSLAHLFVSVFCIDGDYILSDIYEMLSLCPRLINLVVSGLGSMPKTSISDINESEYSSSETTSLTTSTTKAIISSSSNEGESATVTLSNNNYCRRNSDNTNIKLKSMVTDPNASSSTETPNGLRRFVLTHQKPIKNKNNSKYVIRTLKAIHTTLEYLCLDYDGDNVGPNTLNKLTTIGCPRLKEFRIATHHDSYFLTWSQKELPMSSALIRFFSGCPSLEAITLAESKYTSKRIYHYRYLQINTSMLKTIAQKCPRLRHLSIYDVSSFYWDKIYYSGADFLHFADMDSQKGNDDDKERKPTLEYLTVPEMDYGTALALVTKLESLKYIHIQSWASLFKSTEKIRVPSIVMAPVKKILEDRGGSLRIDPYI